MTDVILNSANEFFWSPLMKKILIIAFLMIAVFAIVSCASRPEGKNQDKHAATIINPKDGTKLVLIPEGEFIAGGSGENESKGEFKITLPAYYLAKTEVTNAQYHEFVSETGYRYEKYETVVQGLKKYETGKSPPVWAFEDIPPEYANLPAVEISWNDAKAYCDWAGLRLPTELEWEKGARGTKGSVHQSQESMTKEVLSGEQPPLDKNPYGLEGINDVSEWCSDWYYLDSYDRYKTGNLTPPESGDLRVIRRDYFRKGNLPDYYDKTVGFRCARSL
jgi:formylglycine-generating enzyme required for sulfatase activity